MNNKVFNWLKLPYPLLYGERRDYLHLISTSLFVALLLFVIRPFGLESMSNILLSLFIGKLTFGIVVTSILITQIMPRYLLDEDNWKIWKQTSLTMTNFLFIALFLQYMILENIDILSFALYLTITIIIATGPLLVKLLFTQNRILKENLQQANQSNLLLNKINNKQQNLIQSKKIEKIDLMADDGEQLSLDPNDFIYAKAEKNYIEIFWQEDEKNKSRILRMSFTTLLSQLSTSKTNYIQCHRSYIVNKIKICKVLGNSRGYHLKLLSNKLPIPVSRARSKHVLVKLRKL